MTETETKLHELMPRWAAQQPERCTPIPGTDGMYDLQLDEERILFAGDGTEFDAARAHAAVLEAVRAADDETQRAYLVHLVGLLPMTRVRTWRHFEVTSLTLALATTEQVLEAWVLTLEARDD
ncbi:MAG: hypothetical protein GVY12_12615 [Bacteroidetes bacterium]|jgi:hypothetical protein|nr:hypothetical protein [Bacteroidota bacterium]